jgi:hypothetical protein
MQQEIDKVNIFVKCKSMRGDCVQHNTNCIELYSLRFKIKVTFGHKLRYKIKVMFGESYLKPHQMNWNVAIKQCTLMLLLIYYQVKG